MKPSSGQPPANTPRRFAHFRFGRRIWRHPSVIALIELDGHRIDPTLIIRQRARTLVAEARKFGWGGPPFDPRVLASFRGIKVSPDRLARGHDAFIVPRGGQQLEIVFDTTCPSTRQNFSICHEVCHTLFPDGYEMIRHRYERRNTFDPASEVEQLCDTGAAEILLPEEEFRADIEREGFGLKVVDPFRERYQASREAIIRRMVQLDRHVSAAVFLEYRLKPSEAAGRKQLKLVNATGQPHPKLRIAYAVVSDAFGVFLPRHKSVPDDSCVYRALGNSNVTQARERWEIPGLPISHVEAMSMPPGDDLGSGSRAVALLRL